MFFPLPVAADIHDVTARVAVVEGYNSNTYQDIGPSESDPTVRVGRRHPSPFTGVDAQVIYRITNGLGDIHDFRVQARAQKYTPLQTDPGQTDDGTLNGAWGSRITLNRRLFLTLTTAGTVTTINGARMSDGTIFQFDPTVIRRTYWLIDHESALTYEYKPTWRLRQAVGVIVSGTIDEPGVALPGTRFRLKHRGLDFVQPYSESTVFKDFSERATGDLTLRYQLGYNHFILDLGQNPPQRGNPETYHFGTLTAGYLYRFNPELVTGTRAGFTLATPPPRDIDQRPILSPTVLQEVYYAKPTWSLLAVAGYTYGSFNPRLGAGPVANASLNITGIPIPRRGWRDLTVMVNAAASHATLVVGRAQQTTIDTVNASAEVRYAINKTFGVLAGYDFRYATFQSTVFIPYFARHLVFVGISAFWSTERGAAALQTFAAPALPGG